ncbi:prephenate dehydratase [Bradyrhizobium sp. Pear77]|uniref:prephenate dehydratase n=1 Tax=Bradyrhizobium TaxID=374 RepID=UPI001E286485|nr:MULTISPECIES: prephenate dehydratase domain-containing protein [Bradyrhizobium]MCC8954375.1 prephenate dehydratase [Bradyrhizobium altum]MCC8964365.1 prephenate dehydratase [Bradyrhizobium oropedii]
MALLSRFRQCLQVALPLIAAASGALHMTAAAAGQIGYLGPAGSWTHQACLELFGPSDLVPLSQDELLSAYQSGKIDRACLPVTTSLVGATPYLDPILALPNVRIVAEYPKMLGYSLLARHGTRLEDVKEVLGHPVAFDEVKPWLDHQFPQVRRTAAASSGAAAQAVANSDALDKASIGPKIGASIYGLDSLVDGIEEGPHNVTRWWVLGKDSPPPTDNDKTSLLATVSDADLASLLASFAGAGVQILTIYERPAKTALDRHRYLIEVAGNEKMESLTLLLGKHPDIRALGSYPRRY